MPTRRFIIFCAVLCLVAVAQGAVAFAASDARARVPSTHPVLLTSSTSSQGPAGKPTSLPDLLVQPRDTTHALSVRLLPGGDQVNGQPTLDLCSQTFASESQRIQRLQDVALDASDTAVLSTEAVLYRNAAATQQAFKELRHVRASCPKGPVTNKTDGSSTTTTFHAAPDKGWPRTASVERQAFSFTTVSSRGDSRDSIAVYLRRGRVLLGVYFPKPNGEQSPIDGQTSVAGIVTAFAARIAKLPRSFVADPPR